MDDLDVALVLREARERRACSQAELARRTGTTQSVISRWERGDRSPTVAKLAELLAAMDYDLVISSRPRTPPASLLVGRD